MQRRSFHQLLLGTVGLYALPTLAQTPYPDKPVRILVGYSPGGPTDMVTRLVAASLQAQLGQTFIVENRAGAASTIASTAAAAAAADGYTLLVAAAPITMNAYVFKDLKFNVLQDFAPISKISSSPGVLAVRPNMPIQTLQALIALAKQTPGKLTYGTTGVGGSQHMATVRFEQLTGVTLTHVPYKGAANALADLMAGHIDMAFMTASGAMPHLQAGAVKPIAVAYAQRMATLPDVPSFAELGYPDMISDSWNGLIAPAGTPPGIIRTLHQAVVRALQEPAIREKLEQSGAIVIGNTPEAFRMDLVREVAHWGEQFKRIQQLTQ